MIIIYPLLVSQNVSKNIIPGVCKVMENYILINHYNELLDLINKENKSSKKGHLIFKVKGRRGKFIAESTHNDPYTKNLENRINNLQSDIYYKEKKIDELLRLLSKYKEELKNTKDKRDYNDRMTQIKSLEVEIRAKEYELKKLRFEYDKLHNIQLSKEREKEYELSKKSGERSHKLKKKEYELRKKEMEKKMEKEYNKPLDASVMMSDTKTLSLEPTYMTISTYDRMGNRTTSFLGVKVTPVIIKSNTPIIDMILSDVNRNWINRLLIRTGRDIIRQLYKVIDIFKKKPIRGNVRHDVIYARSYMNKQSKVYLLLDKNEDFSDEILNSSSKIRRLYKSMWTDFIIADQVNRNGYFCFKELQGMCNVIPFQMIYTSLNQKGVYESLEDIRRSRVSIFRIKKNFNKIVKEGYKMKSLSSIYIENYLNELYNNNIGNKEYINEAINFNLDFLKKIKNDVISKNIISKIASTMKDDENIETSIKNLFKLLDIKNIKNSSNFINKFDDVCSNKLSKYSEYKRKAQIVLKNSLGNNIDPKILKVSSLAVAFMSSFEIKNFKFKTIIEKIVDKVRELKSYPLHIGLLFYIVFLLVLFVKLISKQKGSLTIAKHYIQALIDILSNIFSVGSDIITSLLSNSVVMISIIVTILIIILIDIYSKRKTE